MPGAAQTPGDYTAPAERPLCAATAPWTEAAEQVPPSLRNPKTRRATADSTRRGAGGAHLIQENVTGEGADGHGLAGLPTGQELLHAAPTCSRYGAEWRRKAQEGELCGARGVQGKPHHEMNRAVHSWAMNGPSATCERRHAEARREGAQARRRGGGRHLLVLDVVLQPVPDLPWIHHIPQVEEAQLRAGPPRRSDATLLQQVATASQKSLASTRRRPDWHLCVIKKKSRRFGGSTGW